MKTIAILQSSYIPWLGYFDMISQVDEFILYEDTQFTKRDWRNRNWIKTAQGGQWLTIPVGTKGKYLQKISEVRISDLSWCKNHWMTIYQNYKNAAHFNVYCDVVESLYENCKGIESLSDVNHYLLTSLCNILKIKTIITSTSRYTQKPLYKTERLVDLCIQSKANHYISGPAAKAYLEEDLFQAANITVDYMDYSQYQPYTQLHGDFTHHVSILDLLFNTGLAAIDYIKGKKTQ